ncbi:hypothetical protein [Salinispora arenicola]|uniref:hypothetical protein n=1 Tax=Salinispora arenicola TaxID=168697 RepID=UPI00036CFCD9|nr:hypothetical protein [Salinispora arenicola]
MSNASPSAGSIEHRTPTDGTIKQLYGTAWRCGEPTCKKPLYRLSDDTGEFILNSRIAHIHARSQGGPRWDPDMSEAANRDASNLIPLCEAHAWEIDQTPQHFTADILREWKKQQLAEYQTVQRSWTLTDAEVTDVVTVSFTTLEERILGGIYAAAESARQEERRQRQRSLIADMVHAANSWADALQMATISSAGNRWKPRDINEWVTDRGHVMASDMQLIKSNARKLRLETRHPDLLEALDAALTAVGHPEVFDPIWRGSPTKDEERAAVYRHLNRVKRVFLDLEKIGIKVLADPPPEAAP